MVAKRRLEGVDGQTAGSSDPGSATAPELLSRSQARWPLWAVGGGVLGAVGHLVSQSKITEAELATGSAVIGALNRGTYHLGALTGMLAVFCVLVFAAGLRRWVDDAAEDSLAAGVMPLGLVASAGAMIIGYGVKGMLAIYLPGGINQQSYPPEGLYTLFMIDDLVPFIAWSGVVMAAAAMSWTSLRERLLPVWIGVVSALAFLAPLGMLAATGLSGFPGLPGPLWLITVGVGLTLNLRRAA